VRFAAANHETIVTSMRAEVLPNGGSMRIRLDPPQLGALHVTVQIQDGLVTAAFETSTDEATRLLGHSLNQLKSVLESHGVAVDKLQVQQSPREPQTSARNESQQQDQRGGQSADQEQSARQEQQRREMLRRMWRRLTGEPDPLDLTA
jgi:flagellar hook-length control protein FliK